MNAILPRRFPKLYLHRVIKAFKGFGPGIVDRGRSKGGAARMFEDFYKFRKQLWVGYRIVGDGENDPMLKIISMI